MSSAGTIREMTPLLPCRPAILSPGCSLRFTATKTLTIFMTPGGSSSPRCNFSTLLSKRAVNSPMASSICFLSASISAMRMSSRTEICRQLAVVYSARISSVSDLADQQFPHAGREAALEDRAFVVAILRQALDLGPLDRQRALVLLDA